MEIKQGDIKMHYKVVLTEMLFKNREGGMKTENSDPGPPRRSVSLDSALKCYMDKFDLTDIWRKLFNKDYSRLLSKLSKLTNDYYLCA